jgi:hypothetical protein
MTLQFPTSISAHPLYRHWMHFIYLIYVEYFISVIYCTYCVDYKLADFSYVNKFLMLEFTICRLHDFYMLF